MATMSILALYNYDPTVFDGLHMPTAADITTEADKIATPWIPNKNDFVAYLCMNLAELELLYASAPVMKQMITIWTAAHFNEWVQLYNTLLYKYNPIWNKDGSFVETHDWTVTDDYSVTDMKTDHDGDVKENVTGYDTNAYSPNTQQVIDTSDTTNGKTNNTHKDSGTTTRTESGNIGVTTTQAMIKEQREIVQFNLYDFIANQFKTQFCVMVY